jgi:alpha-L-rhamnosidase
MQKNKLIYAFLFALLLPLAAWAKVDVTYLRTEQMVNPMGIDAEM